MHWHPAMPFISRSRLFRIYAVVAVLIALLLLLLPHGAHQQAVALCFILVPLFLGEVLSAPLFSWLDAQHNSPSPDRAPVAPFRFQRPPPSTASA
jgi:hypothetical protein